MKKFIGFIVEDLDDKTLNEISEYLKVVLKNKEKKYYSFDISDMNKLSDKQLNELFKKRFIDYAKK